MSDLPIVEALEDALALLGAPTDGIPSLDDRDIIKHTVAISGWKLKQIHAALTRAKGTDNG